ncbi:hypothetical protein Y032_0021g432 [Ancylostoma ceylanicum]|uniref:Uncharacterized protein n=1 Tax=Ancylostoma ceylanicum TaxID=53326 RepID=A0A016V022_9BILA|nr:hypothetical protein Y032_0021g432 [Ancylostoma ceylanicum]
MRTSQNFRRCDSCPVKVLSYCEVLSLTGDPMVCIDMLIVSSNSEICPRVPRRAGAGHDPGACANSCLACWLTLIYWSASERKGLMYGGCEGKGLRELLGRLITF